MPLPWKVSSMPRPRRSPTARRTVLRATPYPGGHLSPRQAAGSQPAARQALMSRMIILATAGPGGRLRRYELRRGSPPPVPVHADQLDQRSRCRPRPRRGRPPWRQPRRTVRCGQGARLPGAPAVSSIATTSVPASSRATPACRPCPPRQTCATTPPLVTGGRPARRSRSAQGHHVTVTPFGRQERFRHPAQASAVPLTSVSPAAIGPATLIAGWLAPHHDRAGTRPARRHRASRARLFLHAQPHRP